MNWLHTPLRLWTLMCALAIGAGSLSQPTPAPPPQSTAAALPEVRLRKLHLVRPDLIPYPIAYEFIC